MRKNVQITHFTNVVYFSNRYKKFFHGLPEKEGSIILVIPK